MDRSPAARSPARAVSGKQTGPVRTKLLDSLQLVFRLPRDHSVGFPDSTAFVTRSFQGFIGDFRPKLF